MKNCKYKKKCIELNSYHDQLCSENLKCIYYEHFEREQYYSRKFDKMNNRLSELEFFQNTKIDDGK